MAEEGDADITAWAKCRSGHNGYIIVAVISLSPLFLLFMAGVIGRSLLRTLWRAVGASALAEM
jgi:hypothetical protein